MDSGNILNVASDMPSTVSPHSLLISSSSSTSPYMSTSPTSAPIPPPPIITTTTRTSRSPSVSSSRSVTISSRPARRYVRPRATTEEEREQRLQERRVANRTAAKQSRDRQKQAMEQAQLENERLKSENADLRSRVATLEQRMQALEQRQPTTVTTPETQPQTDMGPHSEEQVVVSTHQSARPMYPMEPQCPTTLVLSSHLSSSRLTQTRLVVYALQILMHSFVLSLSFPPHLLPETLWTRWISSFHPFSPLTVPSRRQQCLMTAMMARETKISRLSSRWMLAQTGYATPNRDDLSGAIRSAGIARGERRMRVRILGKESLRMVRRDGRGNRGSCIRLIIKKARQHMDK